MEPAAAAPRPRRRWRSVDAADEVFFLLDIEDRGRAAAFTAPLAAAAVCVHAGLLDGDFHFLEAFPASRA